MKVSHCLVVLAALTGTTPSLAFKMHVHVHTSMTWYKARDYCRLNYADLSIVDTLAEYNRFKNQTTEFAEYRSWIGLRKNPDETKYTQWCDGTVLGFTKWDSTSPSSVVNEHCVSIKNNSWSDYLCEKTLPFFCMSEVAVIEEMKTWDEALEHCRTHYTNLISVTTSTNLLVFNGLKNTGATFWTGLRFVERSWVWVNKQPLGNLVSLPSCPNKPFVCGARNADMNVWELRDCNHKMFFICYS